MNRKVKLADFFKLLMIGVVLLLGVAMKDSQAMDGILNYKNLRIPGSPSILEEEKMNEIKGFGYVLSDEYGNEVLKKKLEEENQDLAETIDSENHILCRNNIVKKNSIKCDFINDNSIVQDDENSPLYKLLSNISISSGEGQIIKGSPEYCQKCFQETFPTMKYSRNIDFDEIQNEMRKKMQYQKLKTVMAPLITNAMRMTSYYNKNKKAIDYGIQKKTEQMIQLFTDVKPETILAQVKNRVKCSMFKEVFTPLEDVNTMVDVEAYMDGEEGTGPKKILSKNDICLKNAKGSFVDLAQSFDSSKNFNSLNNSDIDVGAEYNKLLSHFIDEELKKAPSKIPGTDESIKKYIATYKNKLVKNYDKVKEICSTGMVSSPKKRDQYIISLTRTLYVEEQNDFADVNGQMELDQLIDKKITAKRTEISRYISIDPDLLPFFHSKKFLCKFLEDHPQESLANLDLYNIVKTKKENEAFRRIESMALELCPIDSFNVMELVCGNNDEQIANIELETEELSSIEKFALRSIQCVGDPAPKNSLTAKINKNIIGSQSSIDAAAMRQLQNVNNKDFVNANKRPFEINDYIKSDPPSSVRRGENTVQDASHILAGNKEDDDLFDFKAKTILGTEITTDSAIKKDVTSTNSKEIESAEAIDSFDSNDAPEEQDFSKMVDNLVSDSYQVGNNNQLLNNANSRMNEITEGVNNSKLTETKVMDAANTEELGDDFAKIQKKLIDGEKSQEALVEALASGGNIDDSLIPSGTSKSDLEKEIAELKAQMEILTKKKELEAVKEEAEKVAKVEIDELKEKNKRLSNVIKSAGIKLPKRDAASLSGSSNSNQTFGKQPLSQGGDSYEVPHYNDTTGERILPNPPPTYVGRKKELSLTSASGTPSNGLFLSLSDNKLVMSGSPKAGAQKLPLQIDNVILDETTKEIKRVVVFGDKEIEYSNLSNESKIAVKLYLDSVAKKNEKVSNEKQRAIASTVEIVSDKVSAEISRYDSMLFCLDNPADKSCTVK